MRIDPSRENRDIRSSSLSPHAERNIMYSSERYVFHAYRIFRTFIYEREFITQVFTEKLRSIGNRNILAKRISSSLLSK